MRCRRRTALLLAAPLLVAGLVACGDDADDSAEAETVAADDDGTESTDADTTVAASGEPGDPCTLLTEDDFASVLEVSVVEPEDVSDRFVVGGPDVDSRTCQWEATTRGDGLGVSVYSVELLIVTDDIDGEVYADLVENVAFFDAEVSDLDLGDEAVGVVDDGSPEIIVHRGEVLLKLSTSSDDLTVDDLLPLAESALGEVETG